MTKISIPQKDVTNVNIYVCSARAPGFVEWMSVILRDDISINAAMMEEFNIHSHQCAD